MDFSNEIAQFTQGLQNYTAAIKTAFQRKRTSASSADNATAVAGQSSAQLTANLRATYDAHMAATNPHGETPAMLGIYDAPSIDNILSNLVPSGILPISYWKRNTFTANTSSFTVTFTPTTAILSGKFYNVPSISIDLTTVDPAPASKKFLLYAQLVNGAFTYIATPEASPLAESDVNMYLGYLQCGANGVSSYLLPTDATRLGTYRLSTTAAGSSIPVSLGRPSQIVSLPWT